MTEKKRRPIQFFTYKEMNLALCDDGTVWSFETRFVTVEKKNVEQIVWLRRQELENPGN